MNEDQEKDRARAHPEGTCPACGAESGHGMVYEWDLGSLLRALAELTDQWLLDACDPLKVDERAAVRIGLMVGNLRALLPPDTRYKNG